ncbi:hypothetical protein [Lapidilactobacillus salsurivasis]
MYQAVLVYNSDPLLRGKIGQALIQRDSNVAHYQALLDRQARQAQAPWQFELDQTDGDIAALLAHGYDAIICLPGLQHRLVYPDGEPRIYFLDNVEFRADELDLVWARLQILQQKTIDE